MFRFKFGYFTFRNTQKYRISNAMEDIIGNENKKKITFMNCLFQPTYYLRKFLFYCQFILNRAVIALISSFGAHK